MKENKIVAYLVLGIIVLIVTLILLWLYSFFANRNSVVISDIDTDQIVANIGYIPREVIVEYRADGGFYRYPNDQIPLKFSAGISIEQAENVNLPSGQSIQVSQTYGQSDDMVNMLYSEGDYPGYLESAEYYVLHLESQRRYKINLENARDPRVQHQGEPGVIEDVAWSGNKAEVIYRVGAQKQAAYSIDEREPWRVRVDFAEE